jgi:hypothetical protein
MQDVTVRLASMTGPGAMRVGVFHQNVTTYNFVAYKEC